MEKELTQKLRLSFEVCLVLHFACLLLTCLFLNCGPDHINNIPHNMCSLIRFVILWEPHDYKLLSAFPYGNSLGAGQCVVPAQRQLLSFTAAEEQRQQSSAITGPPPLLLPSPLYFPPLAGFQLSPYYMACSQMWGYCMILYTTMIEHWLKTPFSFPEP